MLLLKTLMILCIRMNMILRWWEKFGTVFDKILLSCHHKEVDIDHFIKVSDTLHEMGRSPNVMVLMDPSAWDKCLELIETCKTSKHPCYGGARQTAAMFHCCHEMTTLTSLTATAVRTTTQMAMGIA